MGHWPATFAVGLLLIAGGAAIGSTAKWLFRPEVPVVDQRIAFELGQGRIRFQCKEKGRMTSPRPIYIGDNSAQLSEVFSIKRAKSDAASDFNQFRFRLMLAKNKNSYLDEIPARECFPKRLVKILARNSCNIRHLAISGCDKCDNVLYSYAEAYNQEIARLGYGAQKLSQRGC